MKHYETIPWNGKRYRIQIRDAKKGTDWAITVDELDNTDGQRGQENDCVMANAANRLRKLCLYKVIGWVMRRTRAIGITRVNAKGEPTHGVRFIHYHGKKQRAFDEGGKFKPGDVVMLHAPRGRDRLGRRPKLKKRYQKTGTRPDKRPSKLMRVAFSPRSRSLVKWAELIVEKQQRDTAQAVEKLVAQASA